MRVHHFNVEDAERCGVEKAVILYNLRFWLDKVQANDKDTHKNDGYYWTYNSAKAFGSLFPYYTERKIHRLLTQLEEDGFILSGNYNKMAYDRTKWYSMPEFAICQNCQMEVTEVSNGFTQSVEPIPNRNPNSNPDVNLISDSDALVQFWNDNRPPQSAVKITVWSKAIKSRLKTFTVDEIKQAMLSVINSQWHQQNNQVLIKNAIDSDKRCAEAIEKSNQTKSNQTQVNRNENNQRPNSQNSKPNHFDNLRAEARAKYGNAPTDTNELRTVN